RYGRTHGRAVPTTLFAHTWRRLHFGGTPQRHGQPARCALLISGRLSLGSTRHEARATRIQCRVHGRLCHRDPDPYVAGGVGWRGAVPVMDGNLFARDDESGSASVAEE